MAPERSVHYTMVGCVSYELALVSRIYSQIACRPEGLRVITQVDLCELPLARRLSLFIVQLAEGVYRRRVYSRHLDFQHERKRRMPA